MKYLSSWKPTLPQETCILAEETTIPDEKKEPEEHALKDFEFDINVKNDGTFEDLWQGFKELSTHPS